MATGIFIDHGNGNTINREDRIAKFIGIVETNGKPSGSLVDTRTVGKKLFFVSVYVGVSAFNYAYNGVPVAFNSSNGEIRWDYTRGVTGMTYPSEFTYHKIFYGVY